MKDLRFWIISLVLANFVLGLFVALPWCLVFLISPWFILLAIPSSLFGGILFSEIFQMICIELRY